MAARGDETVNKAKGPWIHRFMIYFFTVVLAVLVFWVLGFLVEDIGAIRGPQYTEIEQRYVDQDLVDRAKTLMAEITDVDRAISDKREEMRIVNDSSQNLQNTINQLIELQKLAVQRSVSLSDKEQTNLSESLAHFLESQKRYQVYNTELSRLTDRKRSLESERSAIEKKIAGQTLPAGEEFRVLREKHDLRLAGYQLLILLPMLAAGAIFVVRKRGSVYFPLFLGFAAATLLKTAFVIHRYFPARYVKYVLVGGLLIAVIKLLVYFIRVIAFPKADLLMKQYREGYERFFCPVCDFPIRRGPRKFLFWTRRTVGKLELPRGSDEDSPYSCPACGTVLFEECPKCHNIRYSLLTFCQHCGAVKEIEHGSDNAKV
ncbi:MAG: hypothetical protein GXY69_08490 [Synergistaceae bacterium]|nr:hypothetical protein [Synergistaceae bacterium]